MFDATTLALNMGTIDVEVRPRLEDDAPSILLDPSKTNETFDWVANTQLKEGVKKAVSYYHKFGIKENFTHLHSVEE